MDEFVQTKAYILVSFQVSTTDPLDNNTASWLVGRNLLPQHSRRLPSE